MRRTHFGFLIFLGLLIITFVAAGTYAPGSRLLAQQGATGTVSPGGSNSSSDTNSGYGTNNGSSQNPGSSMNNGRDSSNGNGTTNVGPNSNGTSNSQDSNLQTPDQARTDAGQTADQPGVGTNQAPADTGRAGAPWGWMIGSFIVGLIVGGLAFRGRTQYRDRDRTDFRRAA